jgi:predicted  nucleic acid-binding Zn-ribbon protein
MKGKLACLALLCSACSPLKTSEHDEKHQLELTLHELKITVDDVRHQTNCFQTELQILEGRIKHNENALAALKAQDFEKQQSRLEQLSAQLQALEKKWSTLEKTEEMGALTSHAKETTTALVQFKQRIEELEREQAGSQRRLETLVSSKVYKVRSGDTLKKIADHHGTTIDKLKKTNDLQQDKIVAGQELKLPE